MRIYVLEVSEDDFGYDLITRVVVLAEAEEQAISIANKSRKAVWEVEKVVEIAEACLITEFIHYG